ncbi:phosphocholine-specific phospholipase C [Massilia sp. TWP1-3-3]|uniref:phosphocholine-specific phospholipase C n=1 Tax=Massilia sp. TWP1-3-3 TaxID=2804573 RepID=UPI003CE6AA3D
MASNKKPAGSAVPDNCRSGTIMDVAHIVILMQENRSFDHYFGTMPGVRGFGDRFPIPVPVSALAPSGQERDVWTQRAADGTLISPFHLDTGQSFAHMRAAGTPHTWPDAQRAWNNGILDAWPTHKHKHAMGYFTQADIPFQFALANAFTVCDAYHCAVQAGTNPNRVYAWTGSIDPLRQGHSPVIGNSYDNVLFDPDGGYTWSTYGERLQAAGVSWQVYQDTADNDTDNPLAGFKAFRDALAGVSGSDPALRERGMSTRTLDQLRADVAAGTLAQVSFIVATADGSEHPVPSSPAQGANYTAGVIGALSACTQVWSKTVLLLMFDENDGFFDHMPPPAAPSYQRWDADPDQAVLAGASTVTTAGEYHEFASTEASETPELMHRPYGLGPRVPMYVISPWSTGGWVNSQVVDHSSVIRFMERRFGVPEPNISPWRRAVCGDLTSAFDFTRPDDRAFFAALPATGELAARARTGRHRVAGAAAACLPACAAGRHQTIARAALRAARP